MTRRLKTLALGLAALLLSSCASVKIQDYADTQPRLDIITFLSGKTQAWGQFQDRSGKVLRRFKVWMTGEVSATAQGRQLVLTEDFLYDDGEKQQRIWTITETAPFRYTGKAADVIGEATGEAQGMALNWKYTLDLPYDGDTIHVQFNDWMYQFDARRMFNIAKVTKFGFEVGQVTLFFERNFHQTLPPMDKPTSPSDDAPSKGGF
jgi:hypothetical protein